jgi:hypothetical protein
MTVTRIWTTVAATLAATFVFATVATADVEPNDVISQAEGPVSAGPITGTLLTPGDTDYVLFYVASQQTLRLVATDTTNDAIHNCLAATLSDADGQPVRGNVTSPPGTSRMFVHTEFHGGASCRTPLTYRLDIEPASAFATGPPLDKSSTATTEPNETPADAVGPLSVGVTYSGRHEISGDRDWFAFQVPSGHHDLEITTTSPTHNFVGCAATLALYSTPSARDLVATAIGDWTTFGHLRAEVNGPNRYYLLAGTENESCDGSFWQFRIDRVGTATTGTGGTSGGVASAAQTRFTTSVSVRRRGTTYRGRVSSARAGCKVGRRVVLRKVGSGTRRFGTGYSRGDGTFRITRARRLGGRVYVMAAGRDTPAVLCRNGRSPTVSG